MPKFLVFTVCRRLALPAVLLCLAACGQKGPLYIPEPVPAPASIPESAQTSTQNESN